MSMPSACIKLAVFIVAQLFLPSPVLPGLSPHINAQKMPSEVLIPEGYVVLCYYLKMAITDLITVIIILMKLNSISKTLNV